jgi:hypothetical protein
MLVAVLIPVLLLIATVLMQKFETRVLDVPFRRRPVRPPLRLEAAPARPVAQRHLKSVGDPEPLVVDARPVEVVDEPLRRVS